MNPIGKTWFAITAIAVVNAPRLRAQSQPATLPAFEVASIKPYKRLGTNVRLSVSGPRVNISEYGLTGLVMSACNIEPWQVSGGPVWLQTDHVEKPSAN